jgi:hypothetical protein
MRDAANQADIIRWARKKGMKPIHIEQVSQKSKAGRKGRPQANQP